MSRLHLPIVWAYLALVVIVVGMGLFRFPYSDGPAFPALAFHRETRQTLGGLAPGGLWQPAHAEIRSSVNRLAPIRLGRELGNSLRLAAGQRVEWIVWGGRRPLMLFPTLDLWVSHGLTAQVESELSQVAEIIADYKRRLAAEGWAVVVVPVPVKLGIHRELCEWPVHEPNLLSRRFLAADRSDEVYGHLHRELDKRGVTNVDLQTLYRDTLSREPQLLLYATNDSHWAGPGIRLAAEATARAIAGNTTLRVRAPQNPTFLHVDHVGDLAKAFDPLPGLATWLRPAWNFPDELVNGEEGRGYHYPAAPDGVVVAVGTSYTGQYTWITNQPVGFAWQLGLHLESAEVQNRPMAGQGSFQAFKQFWLKRHEIANEFAARRGANRVRVVVWEFPIRDALGILGSSLQP